MKVKILAVGLVCLCLSFCATKSNEKILIQGSELPKEVNVIFQESTSFDSVTFQDVWEGCLKTLIEMDFDQYGTNETEGRILAMRRVKMKGMEVGKYLVREESGKETIVREETPGSYEHFYLYFLISESEGSVTLDCKVAGSTGQAARGKTEMKRFLKILDEYLNN